MAWMRADHVIVTIATANQVALMSLAVVALYAAANSGGKLAGCKSAPIPVRRGVVQVCPLSPVLYA